MGIVVGLRDPSCYKLHHARRPRPVRIVYDADDSAARELAERFVGIGTYPRASGLTGDALAQALRRGNESAYVLSLDRRPLDAVPGNAGA